MITRRAWPLPPASSILVVCAVAVIAPRLPRAIAPPDPAIRLVVANVWDENPTPEEVPASMLDRGADVLVAVEMLDDEFYEAMTHERRLAADSTRPSTRAARVCGRGSRCTSSTTSGCRRLA